MVKSKRIDEPGPKMNIKLQHEKILSWSYNKTFTYIGLLPTAAAVSLSLLLMSFQENLAFRYYFQAAAVFLSIPWVVCYSMLISFLVRRNIYVGLISITLHALILGAVVYEGWKVLFAA